MVVLVAEEGEVLGEEEDQALSFLDRQQYVVDGERLLLFDQEMVD